MERKITVDAVTENLGAVLEWLEPSLDAQPFAPEVRVNLEIAAEEIFLNIANYAYAPETGTVSVCAVTDEDGLTITFADSGKAFNPLELPAPDINIPLHERQIGGLGIYMVRQIMDSVEYARRDGRNILSVRKRIS